MKSSTHALPGNEKISNITTSNGDEMAQYGSEKEKIFVEAYVPLDPGPYPQDQPKQNSVRFTPTQVFTFKKEYLCIFLSLSLSFFESYRFLSFLISSVYD